MTISPAHSILFVLQHTFVFTPYNPDNQPRPLHSAPYNPNRTRFLPSPDEDDDDEDDGPACDTGNTGDARDAGDDAGDASRVPLLRLATTAAPPCSARSGVRCRRRKSSLLPSSGITVSARFLCSRRSFLLLLLLTPARRFLYALLLLLLLLPASSSSPAKSTATSADEEEDDDDDEDDEDDDEDDDDDDKEEEEEEDSGVDSSAGKASTPPPTPDTPPPPPPPALPPALVPVVAPGVPLCIRCSTVPLITSVSILHACVAPIRHARAISCLSTAGSHILSRMNMWETKERSRPTELEGGGDGGGDRGGQREAKRDVCVCVYVYVIGSRICGSVWCEW